MQLMHISKKFSFSNGTFLASKYLFVLDRTAMVLKQSLGMEWIIMTVGIDDWTGRYSSERLDSK